MCLHGHRAVNGTISRVFEPFVCAEANVSPGHHRRVSFAAVRSLSEDEVASDVAAINAACPGSAGAATASFEWLFRLVSENPPPGLPLSSTKQLPSSRAGSSNQPREIMRGKSRTPEMKLLISAYACAPHWGSEEATGWYWTTEAGRLGHQVWALASPTYRKSVEEARRADPDLKDINWVFPEVRGWPAKPAIRPRCERAYYLLWQRAALHQARALHRRIEFDAVHHVTWAGFRIPTFLGSLGPPLILGPIGGGETSPLSLRDEFSLRGSVSERIRDFANATVMINPWIRRELIEAAIIFASTSDTRNLFSRSVKNKTFVFTPLVIPNPPSLVPRVARQASPRLLCAARLVYWKGVHIAIRAFAHVLSRYPEVRFTIVGRGPEEQRLKAEAARYDLADRIDFISWLPQQQLFDLYESHDLFVFPSLHDSAGFVVLEALSRGLPVVCLDLGGPKHIVTSESGIVIDTGGLNTAQVAAAMAEEISRLLSEPARLATLSAGAVARAHDFILSNRVAAFYDRVTNFTGLQGVRERDKDVSQAHA
jgi:glycosyltransferase involved in cell wall biosynthesis